MPPIKFTLIPSISITSISGLERQLIYINIKEITIYITFFKPIIKFSFLNSSLIFANIDLGVVRDHNQLHKNVKMYLHPFRMKVFDNVDNDSRTSMHISVNIKGDSRYAILSSSSTYNQLITVSIEATDDI